MALTTQEITAMIVAPSNELVINAFAPAVIGKQYPTFYDAFDYININSPATTNDPRAIRFSGNNGETLIIPENITIRGDGMDTSILSGSVDFTLMGEYGNPTNRIKNCTINNLQVTSGIQDPLGIYTSTTNDYASDTFYITFEDVNGTELMPDSGDFTLQIDVYDLPIGEGGTIIATYTTAPMAYNADSNAVQNAIMALATPQFDSVLVTGDGSNVNPFSITLYDFPARITTITSISPNLYNGSDPVYVNIVDMLTGVIETTTIDMLGIPNGGNYVPQFLDSSSMSWNANMLPWPFTAIDIQSAIRTVMQSSIEPYYGLNSGELGGSYLDCQDTSTSPVALQYTIRYIGAIKSLTGSYGLSMWADPVLTDLRYLHGKGVSLFNVRIKNNAYSTGLGERSWMKAVDCEFSGGDYSNFDYAMDLYDCKIISTSVILPPLAKLYNCVLPPKFHIVAGTSVSLNNCSCDGAIIVDAGATLNTVGCPIAGGVTNGGTRNNTLDVGVGSGGGGGKGADVASANDMDVIAGSTLYDVTGAVTINDISTLNMISGSTFTLQFDDAPLVMNAQVPALGYAPIILAGSLDFQAATGSRLTLIYDGDALCFREIGRTTL